MRLPIVGAGLVVPLVADLGAATRNGCLVVVVLLSALAVFCARPRRRWTGSIYETAPVRR